MEYKLYQQKVPSFSKIYFPNIGISDNGSNRFFPVGCIEIPNISNGDLLQVSSFISLNAEDFKKSYVNTTCFLAIHNSPVTKESPTIIGKSIAPTSAENMAGRDIENGVVYRIKTNSANIIVNAATYRPLYLVHYCLVRSTRATETDWIKYAGLRKDGSVSDAYYLLEALHFKN